MIGYLKGQVMIAASGKLLLLVNGVGYRLFVSSRLVDQVTKGQELAVFTHLRSREDGIELYGFASQEELQLFELLNTVSGVGPKSALAIMEAVTIKDIQQAAAKGDPALLTKVSGIGPKTAGRIVLELKGKLGEVTGLSDNTASGVDDSEVVDALSKLGYKRAEIQSALRQLDPSVTELGERLRAALRNLQK